ncbi:hypothetical protein SAMD00020551_4578 [Mesobacillus selenatarsenatis SF-1]|uniref:Uncharacterized protein n=1 Tax=Mesobacillus selenatarsenatis (strain DSM 18680 / JCM 14380 / FERM P-15431 / SF-1) TaxID=1321606 RepID=A0A0A8X910_MESS1|nr:hypothetical protein SAMD00020551_4578 [Mesobacillus selenatarsenatis SF-1]
MKSNLLLLQENFFEKIGRIYEHFHFESLFTVEKSIKIGFFGY